MIGNIPNLWPEFGSGQAVITPKAILYRQALVITEKTQDKIRGEVTTKVLGRDFIHTLSLKVPELDGFSHFLISARHSIDNFYPLRVALCDGDDSNRECASEDAFIELVKKVLGHGKTQDTVRALIAQCV